MVRPLRILFEGATYHIFSKGNLDDFILAEKKDKGYFLKLLGDGAEKYLVDIFTYCLMDNHYHLLARTQKANLPVFMHFLLSSYSSYLAREGRKGHIFAGRYKAILIDTEEYLLTVSKYIHLNPIKALLTDSPGEYKWSGYKYFLINRKAPAWFEREWVVDFFAPGLGDSLIRYREFVEKDMDKEYPYPQDKVVAQAILGNEEFVKKAMAKHESRILCNEITRRRQLLLHLSLKEINQSVCRYYDLPELKRKPDIAYGTRQKARVSFIYLAREYTHYTNAEIAELIGDISGAGVSESYRRTKKSIDSDEKLQAEINKIKRIVLEES